MVRLFLRSEGLGCRYALIIPNKIMDIIYTDEESELRTGLSYTYHGTISQWQKPPGKNLSMPMMISPDQSTESSIKINVASATNQGNIINSTGHTFIRALRTRFDGMKITLCSIVLHIITTGTLTLLKVQRGLTKCILAASKDLMKSYPQAPVPSPSPNSVKSIKSLKNA